VWHSLNDYQQTSIAIKNDYSLKKTNSIRLNAIYHKAVGALSELLTKKLLSTVDYNK